MRMNGSLSLGLSVPASPGPGVRPLYTVVLAFWGLYAAYHTMAAANHEVGVGRMIHRISIVSAATGQEPSVGQAALRACVRTALALLGVSMAKAASLDALFLLPVSFEWALVSVHPLRQTIADLVAGTVVIATPPLQPHRAPAAPMYSRTDAEFGPPPKK